MNNKSLSDSDARSRIFALADTFSWESIAKAMILVMNGEDVRQHLDCLEADGFILED